MHTPTVVVPGHGGHAELMDSCRVSRSRVLFASRNYFIKGGNKDFRLPFCVTGETDRARGGIAESCGLFGNLFQLSSIRADASVTEPTLSTWRKLTNSGFVSLPFRPSLFPAIPLELSRSVRKIVNELYVSSKYPCLLSAVDFPLSRTATTISQGALEERRGVHDCFQTDSACWYRNLIALYPVRETLSIISVVNKI